jgi:GxxExxY protein
LVEGLVIVELKCVERIQRIHEAQLLTYLRLAHIEVGLLFNFHCDVLTRGGVVRKVLQPEVLRASASPR